MTEEQFNILVSLIRAHVVHAKMIEGRQFDREYVNLRQMELDAITEAARLRLVPDELRKNEADMRS